MPVVWEIEKELLRACERLIQQGALQEGSFLAACAIQEVNGDDLGLILERMGVVSSETLQMALAQQWGCRFLSDEQAMLLWEEGAIQPPRQIALAWMRQGRFVPLRVSGGSLTVLVWRPLSENIQTRLCQAAGCAHLEYILISSYALAAILERLEPGKEALSITSGELDALIATHQTLAPSERPVGLQINPSLGMEPPSLTQGLPVVRTISSDDLLPSAKEPTLLDFIEPNPPEHRDLGSQSLSDLIAAPEDLSGDALPHASGGSGDALSSTANTSPSGASHPNKRPTGSSERFATPSSDKRTAPPPSLSLEDAEQAPPKLIVTNPMSLVSPGSLATMSLDTISGARKAPLNPMAFLEEMVSSNPPASSTAIPSPLPTKTTKESEPKTTQSGDSLAATSLRLSRESGDVAFFGAATPRGKPLQGAEQKSGGALVIGGVSKDRSTLGGLPAVANHAAPIDPIALLPQSHGVERPQNSEISENRAVGGALGGREQAQAWITSEQVAASSDALDVIGSNGTLRHPPARSVYTPESLDSLESSQTRGSSEAHAEVVEAPTSADLLWASEAKPMFVEEEPTSVDNEPLFAQDAKRRSAQKEREADEKGQLTAKKDPASLHLALSETPEESKPLMRTGRDYRTLPVGVVPSLIRSLEQEEPSFALFERAPHPSETTRAKLPSRSRELEKEETSDSSSKSSSSGKLESPNPPETRSRIPSSSALKSIQAPPHSWMLRVLLAVGLVIGLSLGLWYFLLRGQYDNAYQTDDTPAANRSRKAPLKQTVPAIRRVPAQERSVAPNPREEQESLWHWDPKQKKLVPKQP